MKLNPPTLNAWGDVSECFTLPYKVCLQLHKEIFPKGFLYVHENCLHKARQRRIQVNSSNNFFGLVFFSLYAFTFIFMVFDLVLLITMEEGTPSKTLWEVETRWWMMTQALYYPCESCMSWEPCICGFFFSLLSKRERESFFSLSFLPFFLSSFCI